MPALDGGAYLLGYLFEIGPAMSGPAGPCEISHEEICCWQDLTGIDLQAWEARTLRRLSREYVDEMNRATSRDAAAPWVPEAGEPDYAGVAMDMRRAIARMANF